MSNIKPIESFCVDMSEATEDEIRNLHKMCIDAGASDYESAWSWLHGRSSYSYMGIDDDGDMIALDVTTDYQDNLISLDKVSAHLGLTTPVRCFTTGHKQSHSEDLKPLKWTPECLSQGIPFQVGMQVSIDSVNVKGEFNIVTAIGEEFVLLKVDDTEKCVRKEEVLPYKEVVLSQREKVMAYLEQEFDEEDSSIIYNEILKLGVFKEDGEYAEQ